MEGTNDSREVEEHYPDTREGWIGAAKDALSVAVYWASRNKWEEASFQNDYARNLLHLATFYPEWGENEKDAEIREEQ